MRGEHPETDKEISLGPKMRLFPIRGIHRKDILQEAGKRDTYYL